MFKKCSFFPPAVRDGIDEITGKFFYYIKDFLVVEEKIEERARPILKTKKGWCGIKRWLNWFKRIGDTLPGFTGQPYPGVIAWGVHK